MPPKKKKTPLHLLRLLAGEPVQADASARPPVRRKPVTPSVRALPERQGNRTDRVFRDYEREAGRTREIDQQQQRARFDSNQRTRRKLLPQNPQLASELPPEEPEVVVRQNRSVGAMVADRGDIRQPLPAPPEPTPRKRLGEITATGIGPAQQRGEIDPRLQGGRALRAQAQAAEERHRASAMPAGAERKEIEERAADKEDVASRALRDARITASLNPRGAAEAEWLSLGAATPRARARRERDRIIAADDMAKPEEMRRVGMLDDMNPLEPENPAYLGSERFGPGRMAAEFGHAAVGMLPALPLEGALAARAIPALVGRTTASAAVRGGAKRGIASLAGREAEAAARLPFSKRATLGQRSAREAMELQIPGAITEANLAESEGRDPRTAALIGGVAGAGLGATFPVAGALLKSGLSKTDMALGRSGVLQTANVARRRKLAETRAQNQSRATPFGHLRETEEAVQERLANPELLATPAVRFKGKVYRGIAGSGHNSAIGELQLDLGNGNRRLGFERLMAEQRLAHDRGLTDDDILEQGFITTEGDFVVRGRPGEPNAGLEGAEADRMRGLIDNDPHLRRQVLEEEQARLAFERDFNESLDAETLPIDESDRLRYLAETNGATFMPERLPEDFEEIPWVTSEHLWEVSPERTGAKPPGELTPQRMERDAIKFHRKPSGVPVTPGVVDAPRPSGARDALDSLRELAGEAGRDISQTLARTADSPVLAGAKRVLTPVAKATRASASRGLDALNEQAFEGVRGYRKHVKPILDQPGVREGIAAAGAATAGAALSDEDESGLATGAFGAALTARKGLKPKSAPTFYSRVLRNAIEPQGRKWEQPRPARDWISHLTKGGDWSQEEVRWTIGPALEQAERDGVKLTKQDVLRLYEDNKLEVQVKTLDEWGWRDLTYDPEVNAATNRVIEAKRAYYKAIGAMGPPGRELAEQGGSTLRHPANEEELRLEMEQAKADLEAARQKVGGPYVPSATSKYSDDAGTVEAGGDEYREYLIHVRGKQLPHGDEAYQDTHFPGDAPENTVAHLRTKTRRGPDGEKILAIEELQAQPSQNASKFGVRGTDEWNRKLSELMAEHDRLVLEEEAYLDRHPAVKRTAADGKALTALRDKIHEAEVAMREMQRESPPDLPFLHNADATLLIWKTAIDIAAREGHEKIVWTTGEQQVRRYNSQLQKAADRLEYDPERQIFRAFSGKEEVSVPGMVDDNGQPKRVPPEKLEKFVGAPAAKKLLAQRLVRKRNASVHSLKTNVNIEAPGMKDYYDVTVPNIAKKYARRLGIEIEIAGTRLPDAATEYPDPNRPPEFGSWERSDDWADEASEMFFDKAELTPELLDEIEYRLRESAKEFHDEAGGTPRDIKLGLKVIERLRRGNSMEKIWSGLSPDDRTALQDAFSLADVSSRGAVETITPVNQGFEVTDELVQAVMNGQAMMLNPFFSPKLIKAALGTRQGKTAALLAGGWALQDIGEELDDDRLEWTGNGIMGLAGLHAFGMPRIRAIGRFAGDAAVNAIRDVEFGRLKSGKLLTGRDILNAISYDILADPELKKVVHEAEMMVAKYDARAAEYGAMLQTLGRDRQITLPNGKKVTLHGGQVADRFVSDIIEGENWEWLAKQLTPEERGKVAVAALLVKNEFEELGRAAVDLGFFAQGTLDAHNRRYLKRLYPDHLADEAGDTGKGARPIAKKRIEAENHRTDLEQHERARMGQVRESSFRTRYRLAEQGRQVAMAKLMSALSGMDGVIHPEYKTILDDIMRTAAAIHALPKGRANKAARGDLMRQLAGFERELEELQRAAAAGELKGDLGNYRTLPEGRGLGPMSGLVVRKDVYDYLQGMPNFFKGSKFAKALQFWKKAHTIWNPGTHFANAVSNLSVIHMKGLPAWEFLDLRKDGPTSIRGAISDLRSYGKYSRILTEAGVLNKNIASVSGTEDRIVLAPESKMEALRQLAEGTTPTTKQKLAARNIHPHGPRHHKTAVGRGISTAKRALQPLDNKLQKAYNAEDNVYRVALLAKATLPESQGGMGMTMEQGVEFVRYNMGDFRTRSPLLVGTGYAVSPFIMYPAKMLPHMLSSVVEHPERWITISLFFGAADQTGRYFAGEELSERDLPPDKRTNANFGYLVPNLVQMPWTSKARKATYASDVGRFTPFSSLSGSPAPGALVGNLADKVPAMLAPSGPMFDIGARMMNTDPYTGEDWIDYAGDSPMQKTGKVAQAVAGLTMPSAVSFHLPRIAGDIRDKAYGRAANDALGLLGLRPREVKQAGFENSMEWEKSEAVQRAKKRMSRELKRTNDPGRRADIREAYRERLQRIEEHFAGKLGRPRAKGGAGSNTVDLFAP